ncbi:MAG: hypothetical protein AAF430_19535 [Myxococcota bacterium]
MRKTEEHCGDRHPTPEELESFEFGALDTSASGFDVKEHVAGCDSCRLELQVMRAQDHGLAIQTMDDVQLELVRNPPRPWYVRWRDRLRFLRSR